MLGQIMQFITMYRQ